MVLHVGGCLTLMLTLTFGLAVAQDTAPVCPQPAPICRSYEIQSCEWALNMVPVYVCRTDLGGLLLGGGMGYQPRPQSVIYQNPYNQQPLFQSYTPPQPQPVYTTYTTRQPAQYRPASQFMAAREVDSQASPQNGQAGTGSQPGGFGTGSQPGGFGTGSQPGGFGTGSQPGGFANRSPGQGLFQGAARDASSGGGQSQPPINSQQLGSYGPRSAAPIYQAPSQPASAAGSSQQSQSSYPGSQAMVSEGSE